MFLTRLLAISSLQLVFELLQKTHSLIELVNRNHAINELRVVLVETRLSQHHECLKESHEHDIGSLVVIVPQELVSLVVHLEYRVAYGRLVEVERLNVDAAFACLVQVVYTRERQRLFSAVLCATVGHYISTTSFTAY